MIGQDVAQYHIDAEIGRGGMGIVYRATDNRLHRKVAIKVLPPQVAADTDARDRFEREARAASALDHPNICTIYEIGDLEDGGLYIAMAFYPGQTLRERLQDGPLPIDEAQSIGAQLADALRKAHASGIVHRDLKPANVMVTDGGLVKLLDFGVAKLGEGADLTRHGSTVGTAAYMSPEQARGEQVGPASDLWSLGVLMYEMAAGRPPFAGGYEQAVLYAVLNQEPPDLPADIDPEYRDTVMRLLQKDPVERPADATELSRTLRAPGTAAAPSAPSVAAAPASFARRSLLYGLPVVLLLGVLAVILLQRRGPSAPVESPRLVILPFNVHGGPELEYLHDGMVHLLADRLDGLYDRPIVDANAVVALVERAEARTIEAGTGAALAAEFGSDSYLVGTASSTGAGLVLTAVIHSGGTEAFSARAEVADAGRVTDAVDALARAILGHAFEDSEQALAALVARSTGPYDAMRWYLRAVDALRRRDFRASFDAGMEAVGIDSTYALGWYIAGRALTWITIGTQPDELFRKALDYSQGLSPRVVEFLRLELNPSADGYRSLLARYPEMQDVRGRLGDFLFHTNPYFFKPAAEGIPYLLEALVHSPDNLEWSAHLAGYLSRGYGPVPVDTVVRYLPPDHSSKLWLTDDTAFIDSLISRLLGDSDPLGLFEAAMMNENFEIARRVVALSEEANLSSSVQYRQVSARVMRYLLELSQGRPSAAVASLAEITDMPDRFAGVLPSWRIVRLLTPSATPATGELDEALADFLAIDTTQTIISASDRIGLPTEPGDNLNTKLYMRGIVAFRQGRMSELEQQAAALARRADLQEDSTLARSFAARLEGLIRYSNGDLEGGLASIDRGFRRLPANYVAQSWFEYDAPVRWIRTDILERLGRLEEAVTTLNSIHDGYSWVHMHWLGPIYLRRGQLEEQLGRPVDALDTYRRYMELYRDAEPLFDEQKRDVQARIDALTAGQAG